MTEETAPEAADTQEAPAPVDQDDMPVADLAQAVLSREIRPRTASVRRLAQAVLEFTAKAPKKKKGKSAKKDGKKRKLARIPQQKGKKG